MPSYRLNRLVEQTATPPIADVQGWIAGRRFSAEAPLLDVSQAVPSYPPAASLREHLALCVDSPDTSLYTSIVGLPGLRHALATHLADDYGGEITAQQIAITAGCNQAFSIAVDALTEPGDEIILPVPYYFNHRMWLDMRGLTAALVRSHDSELRVEAVASAVNERTRAIVLVNPDNPTGKEYSPAFIDSLFELASTRDIALIIDETYKDFRSSDAAAHGLFQRSGWDATFVQLFSFSKAYAITGYRVGAIVGHPRFIETSEKLLDCATICPSHLSQRAALFALAELQGWKHEKATMMKQRVSALRECFKSNELRYELVSSGAYFAYVRHPFESLDATRVARRLADDFNLLCLPGSMFGPGQDRYLRFAFANLEAERIPELVKRLVASQL